MYEVYALSPATTNVVPEAVTAGGKEPPIAPVNV